MLTLPKYHFHTDTFIENLSGCLNQVPALEIAISEYEQEALVLVLGRCLYDELISQLEWSDEKSRYVLKEGSPEKYNWLLNGRTYEYDGQKAYPCGCGCPSGNCHTKKFSGIISTMTISPTKKVEKNYVAFYIYYHWKTMMESVTSGTGEQIPEVANSTTVYNKKKRYRAWNKFLMWVDELNEFLQHHSDDFPNAQMNCKLKAKNIYDI